MSRRDICREILEHCEHEVELMEDCDDEDVFMEHCENGDRLMVHFENKDGITEHYAFIEHYEDECGIMEDCAQWGWMKPTTNVETTCRTLTAHLHGLLSCVIDHLEALFYERSSLIEILVDNDMAFHSTTS